MVTVVSTPEFLCQCKKCASTLSYKYSDIEQIKTNYDYLGEFDIVTGVKCPVCSNIVKVDVYGNAQTKR